MKKILFLIGSLGDGGAEKVLVDTVNGMDPTKYDITVQTIYDEGVHIAELHPNIKYKTIVSFRNALLRKVMNLAVMYIIPAAILYRFFVKADYDLEVAFLEGLPTKILSFSQTPAKKYAWVHTNLQRNFGSARVFGSVDAYRKAYERYDKIICVSEGVKEGFHQRFGELANVAVRYNVLDEEAVFERARLSMDEDWKPENKFIFVSVGRLNEQKGYDRLLRIARRLKEDGFDFTVQILGEGPERAGIEKQIAEYRLEEQVKLLGFKRNPYPYVKVADAFLCTSREEGYSTAAAEALILGVPVITTDCSGMRELFGDARCGRIVENDEDAFYRGMAELCSAPSMLKDHREEAVRRSAFFKKNKRIKELEALFDE